MAFWTNVLKVGGRVLSEGANATAKAISKGVSATGKVISKGASVTGKSIETGAKTSGKVIKFAVEHPKTSIAATAVALPAFGHKEGFVNFAKDKLLGEEEKKKGLVHAVGTLALGDQKDKNGEEKSLVGKATDTLLGDGTYDSGKEKASEIYHGVKETTGNMYQSGKEMVGGFFNGNGMVSDGNGNYYDPSNPQNQNMQQNGSMLGGFMGGLNSAVNTVSGNNVNRMDLASLLLSSWLMFGKFGWLGKLSSMALGGMTLKNINNRHSQQMMQQPITQPSQQAQPINASTMENTSENEDNVIFRHR